MLLHCKKKPRTEQNREHSKPEVCIIFKLFINFRGFSAQYFYGLYFNRKVVQVDCYFSALAYVYNKILLSPLGLYN